MRPHDQQCTKNAGITLPIKMPTVIVASTHLDSDPVLPSDLYPFHCGPLFTVSRIDFGFRFDFRYKNFLFSLLAGVHGEIELTSTQKSRSMYPVRRNHNYTIIGNAHHEGVQGLWLLRPTTTDWKPHAFRGQQFE